MNGAGADAEVVSLLAGVRLFAGLKRAQLERLAAASVRQVFEAQEHIVREGEPSTALYVLLRGFVEVRRRGVPAARLGAGRTFGEAALLVEQARTADVVALSAVECLVLDRWGFWSGLGVDPHVDRTMYERVVRRLRRYQHELDETSRQAHRPSDR